ncbi:MAG: cytochrome c [Bacteriovoracaceae bacterium]|jgi:cytochrome c2|nr:cytochrome c [Bacteriovoracaceae bacterium]
MTHIAIVIFFSIVTYAQDWSKDAKLPGNKKCKNIHQKTICYSDSNRENIYQLDKYKLDEIKRRGSTHALHYPVSVSELQIPYKLLESSFENNSVIKKIFNKVASIFYKINSLDDLYSWIGLHQYPNSPDLKNPNIIYNFKKVKTERMGATVWDNREKLTVSCAACHSSNLFGTKVMGLTNRFPRANEFFIHGKKALSLIPTKLFKKIINPTKKEELIFKTAKEAIQHIGLKKPKHISLDTSLAQVGLSLAKRNLDPYATKNRLTAMFPRKNKLRHLPADSKPAVWWNVKYKTKWLSDGSIESGNPIHTNFLWNEIGRGIDLKKLDQWQKENKQIVKELTAYVFSTKAPRFNDFFANQIDINKAKKGEALFKKSCAGCHGTYEKGWSDEFSVTYEEKIATTKIWFHTKTPTIDVGTDPYRYQGMKYFYKDLNRLAISEQIGTLVKPKKGYVPPPLVGIWARWPYFHNNSVPTLYDILSKENNRPSFYYPTAANDKKKDFDILKNGYPNIKTKENKNMLFNTKLKGLSNMGHTKMLVNADGSEKFTHQDKINIIHFLKTL